MSKRLRIKKLLHASLGGIRPHRGVKRIHASEITKDDFCPRQWVLMGYFGRVFPHEKIPAALAYTFAEGWMKQHALGDDWITDHMFGIWECLACEKITHPQRYPTACEYCGCTRFHYEEMNFVHGISGASGGIDGFVQIAGEKLLAVESKILKGDFFKELETPQAEHRVRTSMYLGIIAASSDPLRHHINTEYASIIYMMRGHGYKQADGMGISPFKEFIVERDDALNSSYFSKAHAVNMSRSSIKNEEASNLYPHGICDNMFCKKASTCMVAKECFSGKYPPILTWVDRKGEAKHNPPEGLTIVVDGSGIAQEDDECPF